MSGFIDIALQIGFFIFYWPVKEVAIECIVESQRNCQRMLAPTRRVVAAPAREIERKLKKRSHVTNSENAQGKDKRAVSNYDILSNIHVKRRQTLTNGESSNKEGFQRCRRCLYQMQPKNNAMQTKNCSMPNKKG